MKQEQVDHLIIECFGLWSAHIATAAEIAIKLKKSGQSVGFVFLRDENPDELIHTSPYIKWYRNWRVGRMEVQLLRRGVKVFYATKDMLDQAQKAVSLAPAPTASAIGEYLYKDRPLGLGIKSSMVSRLKDPYPNWKEHQALIQNYWRLSCTTFEVTRQLIEQYQPKEIYTFNGRFAIPKAIVEAGYSKGVQVNFHERGSTFSKYDVLPYPIHHRAKYHERVLKNWQEHEDDPNRDEIAHSFFKRRRGGDGIGWYSFIDHQEKGKSLEKQNEKTRLVYFSSSDDEFVAIGDLVSHPVFSDQREAIQAIIAYVKNKPQLELIIRVHPHLMHKAENDKNWWNALAGEGVTVLPAEDTIDSYALMESADVVLNYGSTIGIESTYWGKPSITIGDSLNYGMGSAYEPKSPEELFALLDRAATLEPKPIDGCLYYGYFALTFGTPFEYYRPLNLYSGYLGNLLLFDLGSKNKGQRIKEYVKLAMLGKKK